jgi:hypothetical protein
VLLSQLRLDAILDRTGGCRALGCADQPHGVIRAEPITAAGLGPCLLQVRACGQCLRPAVLEREVAQLAALGCPTVAGTEALRRLGNLPGAPRERLAQLPVNTGDLEVPAVLAGALLDRVPLPHKLLGERRAVERSQLPRGSEDRP